ncbi:pilus assembly protein TadC [Mycobacterium sp. CBMA 234]|uniref:type II secretion system F family protein n=1 Tax=Mycolicibacterium sp. CBMA 234 TaxID=1918495 RepID=UPI0012DF0418|nr:type II secretion system F family protein [Mycolicibacterium sp. CBMA 234]MUL64789.1 pilus assembly protein TadC [Mycolicibacterium sp. CBMA 234]
MTGILLLALALLVMPGTAVHRVSRRVPGPAVVSSELVRDDPLAVPSSLDVLAACLSAGMATSSAAMAAAPSAPAGLAGVLKRAAELLALGASPAAAWSESAVGADPHVVALLRLARRSASSGAALAQGVAELAEQARADAGDAADAAAERANVLIAGPLGLCYLPAFVCLGIVPVVAGLAGDVFRSGVL